MVGLVNQTVVVLGVELQHRRLLAVHGRLGSRQSSQEHRSGVGKGLLMHFEERMEVIRSAAGANCFGKKSEAGLDREMRKGIKAS